MGSAKVISFLILSYTLSTCALDCTVSSFTAILPSNATVLRAVSVPENGTFGAGPTDLEFPGYAVALPELCAVEVEVPSSSSSSYRFGVFMPTEWNQRYIATGNGGFGGGINWPGLGTFTRYGFTAMSTDTGHNSSTSDGTWAVNAESQIDWGYRALHGSVVLSKQIVDAYYGTAHQYSYYSGCSTGGRQGFKEVQEFPDDFDGVLAGAPAWWTNHLQPWTVKAGLYNLPLDAPNHIPSPLLAGPIAAEILKQCDPQDGVTDNIISEPYQCDINFETLLCNPGANSSACVTQAQLHTLYQIYSDYVETNQTFIFPHLALGSESQNTVLTGVQSGAPSTLGTDFVAYFLYNTSDWDFHQFSYKTVQDADNMNPGNATADNFDISPFKATGGKLIQYHGYADGLIPTGSSIYLHRKIQQALQTKGESLDDFYRFFLVPGMQHCAGSTHDAPATFGGQDQQLGPTSYSVPGFQDADHDALLALMRWVENGTAPDQIIATKFFNDSMTGDVVRQRPLCPYPKVAKYDGSGNVDEASSWTCGSKY